MGHFHLVWMTERGSVVHHYGIFTDQREASARAHEVKSGLYCARLMVIACESVCLKILEER